jgi:ribonucleoside-triphosphate reductase
MVFSFPMKCPDTSVTRDERTALEQLEHWDMVSHYWCEHKPSVTIYVREHEWLEVGAWVWENWQSMSGVSFLPHSDHIYKQAPYEEITAEEYKALAAAMPEIDFDIREDYDTTTSSQELACVGGACEL